MIDQSHSTNSNRVSDKSPSLMCDPRIAVHNTFLNARIVRMTRIRSVREESLAVIHAMNKTNQW